MGRKRRKRKLRVVVRGFCCPGQVASEGGEEGRGGGLGGLAGQQWFRGTKGVCVRGALDIFLGGRQLMNEEMNDRGGRTKA